MPKLTHFDDAGQAHMVDVGDKPATRRLARAEGYIDMLPQTLDLIIRGQHKKGDVLGVARIAGIMASKKTAELIPLCHPIFLTKVEIDLTPEPDHSRIRCMALVETTAPTGVEMEALTATQIALLTIYDMCKSVDRGMTLHSVRLLEKRGGKSGHWHRR